MPTPAQEAAQEAAREARYRRDWARWRTRRLSWLIGGGAATASVVLGALFAQLLPGHSAAAATGGTPAGSGGTASQPASAPASGGGAAATPGQPGQPAQPSQPQSQAPPPAPVQAPPQVVSGGS